MKSDTENVASWKMVNVSGFDNLKYSHSSHLQYPRPVAGERIPSVDDVSVPGETAQEIAHALDESVELGVDQHLRD